MPEISANILSQPLQIGNVEIPNRVFLAPMSGVTDLPFRKLAHDYGAGLVVSEMVASQALIEGETEMQLKVLSDNIPLHVVQLAGREAYWMGEAAKVAEANGTNIVDINMGCPAKRVTTGYSGSALMRDLDHALKLVEAVVSAVKVPVTLKMRLGWDHTNLNAPELAKPAQEAGVQLITVHGRTRCQFYKGTADWDAVAAVRDAIHLPLVVNGDICDRETARTALEKSGADAVMIGRASYGRPWLPAQIAGVLSAEEVQKQKLDIYAVIAHHEAMLSFYGSELGIRQARKHLGWYMDHLPVQSSISHLKRVIMTSFDVSEIHKHLHEVFEIARTEAAITEIAA